MQSRPFLIQVFIFAGKVKNVFFILPDSGLFLSSLWNGLFSHIVQLLNSQFRDSKGRTVASMSCYFLCNIKQVVFKSVTQILVSVQRGGHAGKSLLLTLFFCQSKRRHGGIGVFCVHCVHLESEKGSCACVIEELIHHIWWEKKNPQLLLWVPNQLPNSVSDLLAPPAAR